MVERGLPPLLRCSMAMAGESPSMRRCVHAARQAAHDNDALGRKIGPQPFGDRQRVDKA